MKDRSNKKFKSQNFSVMFVKKYLEIKEQNPIMNNLAKKTYKPTIVTYVIEIFKLSKRLIIIKSQNILI